MAKDNRRHAPAAPSPIAVTSEHPGTEVAEGLKQLAGASQTEQTSECSGQASMAASLSQDPQLLEEFLLESTEHLSNIEAMLLEIEQGGSSPETLNSAFRSFHTLKGLAGFLDFVVIQEVAHEVETLLDLARNGELTLGEEQVEVVLAAGDYIRDWLDHVAARAAGRSCEPPQGHEGLVARVRAVSSTQPSPNREVKPDSGGAQSVDTESVLRPDSQAPSPVVGARREGSTLKVDTQKLEYLVDMVGELVIAQSMLKHNPELGLLKSPRIQRDLAHLSRVTADVQKTAMAMRMVPIGQLFRRMTRLVRDLCKKNGKLAELEMTGEDVELDRTIVEELADPLVHMIRNSMDHGLESPEDRAAECKPPAGKIHLKASHQAGQIVIELSDDGRGLNRQKILDKAVSRGLVERDRVLTDPEVWQLIFEPGFSTAERVTDVSGRGVGMDVVRKHIHKLRGRIEISSTAGQGTRFILRLPLTLAIIDGLVVVVGQERYIVPIFAVREMFKPSAEMIFSVEGRADMALVRERLLPVIRLGERLGIESRSREICDGLLIVGESQEKRFCLLVDELAGKQEVVIKSLGETFQGVRGVAGGAILGDGRVGLILDLASLSAGVENLQGEAR